MDNVEKELKKIISEENKPKENISKQNKTKTIKKVSRKQYQEFKKELRAKIKELSANKTPYDERFKKLQTLINTAVNNLEK